MNSAALRYGLVLPLAGFCVFVFGFIIWTVTMPQLSSKTRTPETTPPLVYLGQPTLCDKQLGNCHEGVPKEFYVTHSQPRRWRVNKYGPKHRENPHDSQQAYNPPKPEMPTVDNIIKTSSEVSTCHVPVNLFPPKFPETFLSGDTSGRCKFSFEYDADGGSKDIEIISCTHDSLAAATREAVKKWRYEKTCAGTVLLGQRQSSTMRYDLLDEDGKRLPYP